MESRVYSPKVMGEIIRARRKEHKWNQAQLGQQAGLDQVTISLIENGQVSAGLDNLLRILAILGLEMVVRSQGMGVLEMEGDRW